MIRVIPMRLTFEPERAVSLPEYPGALWRGALGARLRRDACITRAPTCEGCTARHRCAYGQVFEPVPSARATGLAAGFRDLPRPYVVCPLHGGGTYGAGRHLTLALVLMEGAFGYLHAMLRAAQRLSLHDVRMRVVDRRVIRPDQAAAPSCDPVRPEGYLIEPPLAPRAARVVLEHPVRLRRDNRTLDVGAFRLDAFCSAILRRVSSLREATGKSMQADFAGLLDHVRSGLRLHGASLTWQEAERYSARQGQRVPQGGLVGTFEVHGDLAPIWPWLWTGQWTHVGKGAVMGLGRYRVEPLK
ncbi:CRISPR system precrRNA processing endoribonuclease RAMP protein Cas6 [Aquisalimonas sp.]|uniref:CRISPR system precrRNA processing endoribonuclease RAMP protein Cas6 n=1 Tax=Aquisalimonas sp. TaxID=1872621 RepID=UPI0025BCD0DF|nr:CRISPR system precrRNA processing endoribonuclease RAMP protein Cas6 [Aquisalimonas sp.]